MEKNLELIIKLLIHMYTKLLNFYLRGVDNFDEKSLSYCNSKIKEYSTLCNFLKSTFISSNYKIKLHNMYNSNDKELSKLGLELINESLKNGS